jgi:hypothetical protein
MSEPWTFDDSWTRPLIVPGAYAAHAVSLNAPPRLHASSAGLGISFNVEDRLPSILEHVEYNSTSNQNGRIGIYTRDERKQLIAKYHEKRKRRVWKKKIRYHCRKNLAERRVRIKVKGLMK